MRTISMALLAPCARATPLPNAPARVAETVIVVQSYSSKLPARVMFDGQRAFAPKGGTLVAAIRRTSFWMLHDLAVGSGDYEAPITILSPADVPQMRIWLHDPRDTICDRVTTTRILGTKPEAGTINERMVRMMQARKVAVAGGQNCRDTMRRKMDIAYFNLNCALAKAPNSPFVLSHDAEIRFAEALPGPKGEKGLRDCRGGAEIRVLKPLLGEQIDAGQGEDPGELKRISSVLIAYAREPAWAAGFAALKITADGVRARHIVGLYAMQRDAEDKKRALEINAMLVSVCRRGDFKKVCEENLGKDRLADDAALYRTVLKQTAA
jgi:hypothetical protein